MSTITKKEDDAIIEGQARFFRLLHGFLNSVAIRCVVQLNIADIINRHGEPITLSQIAHEINSSSLNVDGLTRLMRFLVHIQIFDEVHQPQRKEPLYSLNECSKFLITDTRNTLAPFAMFFTDPLMFSPIFNLNQSIKEGGTATFKTYGLSTWDLFSSNPQANKSFNDAMACFTRHEMDTIISFYDFNSLNGTLVDVGGGVGVTINEIVSKYPHLKGINFDLPHVVSSAPSYEGVTHVRGDMFTFIPHGDSVFLKSIMHNWSDDKCVQILANCRESITKGSGKVIIADIVVNPKGVDVFDDVHINMDMVMLAYFDGGKERTEAEWKKLLEEAGFNRCNIVKMPTFVSIIEASIE